MVSACSAGVRGWGARPEGPCGRTSGAHVRTGKCRGAGLLEALLSSDLASRLCLQASACLRCGMSMSKVFTHSGCRGGGWRRRREAGGVSEARGGTQAGLGPQQAATINTTEFSQSRATLCLALNVPLSSVVCLPSVPPPSPSRPPTNPTSRRHPPGGCPRRARSCLPWRGGPGSPARTARGGRCPR